MRVAALAAAGTAAADLLYATAAVVVGGAAAALVAPVLPVARLVGGAVLVFLGLRMLFAPPRAETGLEPRGAAFATFLLLTLLNPTTVVYFAALVLTLPEVTSPPSRIAFVAGAGLASLSWQELLAAIGAALRGRLSPHVQRATSIAGASIVLLLALRVALG
jgi:threonine/homoserine/homoserine lactone efflux protein